MIIRNRVQCNNCGDIIESTYVHVMVRCSCGQTAIDGGHDYCRLQHGDKGYTNLSEVTEDEWVETD